MKTLWFVACLAAAGCKGTKPSGSASGSGGGLARTAEFRDRMCACSDAACARKVASEMAAWSQAQPVEARPSTPEELKQANAIGSAIGDCMLKASANDSSGSAAATGSAVAVSPPSAATSSVAGVPAECDEYKAAVDKLATCEKMPKAAREQLAAGYAIAAKGWAATPEATRATVKEACIAARDSVLAAGKTQCGW